MVLSFDVDATFVSGDAPDCEVAEQKEARMRMRALRDKDRDKDHDKESPERMTSADRAKQRRRDFMANLLEECRAGEYTPDGRWVAPQA